MISLPWPLSEIKATKSLEKQLAPSGPLFLRSVPLLECLTQFFFSVVNTFLKQAWHLAPAEDRVPGRPFLGRKHNFPKKAQILYFWENFIVWELCFIQTKEG